MGSVIIMLSTSSERACLGLGLRPRPFFRLVFEMNLATKLVRYCLVGIYGHYKPAGTRSTLASLGILQQAFGLIIPIDTS